MGIDQQIDAFFQPIAEGLSSVVFYSLPLVDGLDVKLILLWLVAAALFFTFYLGFANVRYFGRAIKILRGTYENKSDGEITRFQALATSLSGSVGLGNIAGVAIAVSIGGPGAVIWMIMMGLFSMSSKFAEVTLGVKYRQHNDPSHPDAISGGPMYYLYEAFAQRGAAPVGKVLGILFAVCCVGGAVGGGNMFQSNQAYSQLMNVTGGEAGLLGGYGWAFGLALAGLVALVIIGGIRSIANVAGRLVPTMAGIYLLAGLVVIVIHYQNIPGAFAAMFESAFSMEAGLGGLLGGVLVGVQRAAFSNEAGLGSAAIVHAAAHTRYPAEQGLVGMLGPFIDTVVICTLTGLVIVISGAYMDAEGLSGVALTSQAMASGVSWFPYVLALTVFLFAFSTMIAWSYIGEKAVGYLSGENKAAKMTFKIFFCFCVVVGASMSLDNLITFSDAMILSLGIPNILGLFMMAPIIKKELRDYIAATSEA